MLHAVERLLVHLVEFGLAPAVAVVEDGLVARIASAREDGGGGQAHGEDTVALEGDVGFGELAEVEASLDGDIVDDDEVVVGDGPLPVLGAHDGQFLVVGGGDELLHRADAFDDGGVGPDGLMGNEGFGYAPAEPAEGGFYAAQSLDAPEEEEGEQEAGEDLEGSFHGLFEYDSTTCRIIACL